MLFPWAGLFEQLSLADIFVHLDDVQFSKGSFTNRIQVKLPQGRKWMTIPVAHQGSPTILGLRANDQLWRRGHRELLRQSFAEAAFAGMALALFDRVYACEAICELLIASVEETAATLSLPKMPEFVRSSSLTSGGSSWQRVLALTKELGGTRYITGHGGARYLDHAAFEAAGIEVLYMKYGCEPYAQSHGPFTPYVTMLDPIAHLGLGARDVLNPRLLGWREHLGAFPRQRAKI
jgi:hypothetical protein